MVLWGAASSRSRAWGQAWNTEGAYCQRARELVQIWQPVSARDETGSQIFLLSSPLTICTSGEGPILLLFPHSPRCLSRTSPEGRRWQSTKAARWLETKEVKGDRWPFSLPKLPAQHTQRPRLCIKVRGHKV